MCITKREILELKEVINQLNSLDSEAERNKYLREAVEDVDLFISALNVVNKNRLKISKKQKVTCHEKKVYTSEGVIEIFERKALDDIINEYTKQDLADMYLALFETKPLTSSDKKKIAQNIYQHIYAVNRTKALIGKSTVC